MMHPSLSTISPGFFDPITGRSSLRIVCQESLVASLLLSSRAAEILG